MFNDEKIILPPGKSVRLMAGKISQDITKLSGPSWTDGMSSFKSVPLVEVIAELERQYGILVASEIETDEVFTGAFVNNNLKEALASVAIPFGLKYKITNERVTFTKLD